MPVKLQITRKLVDLQPRTILMALIAAASSLRWPSQSIDTDASIASVLIPSKTVLDLANLNTPRSFYRPLR